MRVRRVVWRLVRFVPLTMSLLMLLSVAYITVVYIFKTSNVLIAPYDVAWSELEDNRRTVSMARNLTTAVGIASVKVSSDSRDLPQLTKTASTLLAGTPRSKPGYITIGIPTLKRPKGEYFLETLVSLFTQSSPAQQAEMTVVVMLADRDASYNTAVLATLKARYKAQLAAGLLLVVSAPDTGHLFTSQPAKRTYNDSAERVRWRSKQNLDYAALMEFSAPLSQFYLQIEDDVTAAPNYVQHISDFVRGQRSPSWAILEVSPRGFIGKLFHSADLPKLVTILRSFYLEMPCDFLIRHFMTLLLQDKPIVRKGTLFFHRGKFSSLTNVVRNVDRVPGAGNGPARPKQFSAHVNPPADLFTSMTVYGQHQLRSAYDLTSRLHFWAKDVKEGDHITLVFRRPQNVSRLVVHSGIREKNVVRDFIRNATVEGGRRAVVDLSGDKALCTDTRELGDIRSGLFDSSGGQGGLGGPLRCITIVISKTQTEWVVISEIVVFTNS